jgi:anaerobic magnesium-protoporphyrin IX monomethyl ester cyclase
MNKTHPKYTPDRPLKIALIDPLLTRRPLYLPTGLCYLSAYLKQKLGSAIDLKIFSLSLRNPEPLFRYDPQLIGITSLTHNFNTVRHLARAIKKWNKNIPLLLGGQHISMAPWTLPDFFDYALLGEGEQACYEFVHSLLNDTTPDPSALPNMLNRNHGVLIHSQKLPLIEPLDDIPFPDRDTVGHIESIITLDSHRKFNQSGLRSMQVTTSRGCPYKCKFCQPSIMWEKFRLHSPEYIAEEIQQIHVRYGINAIHIEDDLFITSKSRVAALTDLLGKKNLLNKIKYYVAGRTRQIDDEWVSLLKQLGVVKIEFGIESGSDRIAQYLKSGSTSNEITRSAISMVNQAGLSVFASFIAGSPPETPADLAQTWNLIKWIKKNHSGNSCALSIATPLPGTELWDYAVQNGLIDPLNIDWEKLNTLAKFPKNESGYIHLNRNIPARKLLRKVRFINRLLWLGPPREFLSSIPRRISKIPEKISILLYRLKS